MVSIDEKVDTLIHIKHLKENLLAVIENENLIENAKKFSFANQVDVLSMYIKSSDEVL